MTDDRTAFGYSEGVGSPDAGGSTRRLTSTLPSEEAAPAQAGVPRAADLSSMAELGRLHADFAGFHESYVRHYIALADTKAAVVFGLASSVIAFLFAKQAYHDLLFEPVWAWRTALAYAVALLLVGGAGCAAWVIAPRLPHTGEGLVFFGAVRRYSSGTAYASAIGCESEAGLALARLRHCYDVSGVCWRKYVSLRRALWLTVAGIAAALPLLA